MQACGLLSSLAIMYTLTGLLLVYLSMCRGSLVGASSDILSAGRSKSNPTFYLVAYVCQRFYPFRPSHVLGSRPCSQTKQVCPLTT